MTMRTPYRLPTARLALIVALTLAAAGCSDGDESSSPPSPADTPVPTTPLPTAPGPTVPPGDPDLAGCKLVAGPIVLDGTLARVTGGIAGIDETTFLPASCAADPLPVQGADWAGIEVVEEATDCEDCADAMSGATSEPVEVAGELVPASEIDLAPGETLFGGDLVFVVTRIQPAP